MTAIDEVCTDDWLDDCFDETAEEPQRYEHFRFTADRGQSLLRIDRFLTDRIEHISRNRIQQAAMAGCILANGAPVKSNYKVKPLDIITIELDRPPRDTEIIPEDIPLDIVYEDDHLLVINKEAGMVVHPGHGNFNGTLVNALAWHLKDLPHYNPSDPRLGLVHRIDKGTSGLLVAAKTEQAKTHLSLQFFNKTTERLYNALVWGTMKTESGTIEGNIGRNPKDRLQMCVCADSEQGKYALTHWRLLEDLGYVSFLECRLETGRTHQIRVHLQHTGHPLFNDERYGGDRILKGTTFAHYKQFVHNCFALCPRPALHARTLGFKHPATGETMHFEAPLPQDLDTLLLRWRNYISNREADND